MNIFNLFNGKKKNMDKKQKTLDTTVNKIVHDKRTEFQRHLINIQGESEKLTIKIQEAKESNTRLQKLLTATELIYMSQGGRKLK